MRNVNGELRFSATDLVNHLACRHLTGLSREAAMNGSKVPRVGGEGHDLIARFGDEHEARCLAMLHERGMKVAEIETGRDWATVERAAAETEEAMRSGVDVVFQATFIDGPWSGHADFLVRVAARTDLGDWGYEPVDAKLARSAKVRALLQLGEYAAQVATVQGTMPENVHLWLGSNERFTFPTADLVAFHRRCRTRLHRDLGTDLLAIYPQPCARCSLCRRNGQCETTRRHDDHLSFVAGIRADQVQRLEDQGIATLEALSRAADDQRPRGIDAAVFERLRSQAELQFAARDGQHRFVVLDPAERPDGGFRRLPAPSPHDVFFDLEGNPFREENGIEYLWGISDRNDDYLEWWAHTPADEKRVFEEVVDHMITLRRTHPETHIYHYAHHEVTTLKRLMGQYATRETEVDELLRGGALVDLYAVVKGSVRCSTEGYSLKNMERFYRPGDGREGPVKSGFESIIIYERWRDNGGDSILTDIAAYNKNDCVSTRELDDWLEARRNEAVVEYGEIDRPDLKDGVASEGISDEEAAVAAVRERLLAASTSQVADVLDAPAEPVGDLAGEEPLGTELAARFDDDVGHEDGSIDWLPEITAERHAFASPAEEALWLLAYLLDFHRREARSEFWAYFARREMDLEELFDDSEAVSGLTYVGEVGTVKRSTIHRYEFDPDQPYKLKEGDTPHDPETASSVGKIHRIDPIHGIIEILRGVGKEAPLATALIPQGPVPTDAIKAALLEVGNDIAEHGLNGTSFRSIADLLLRDPPRLASGDLRSYHGTDAGDAVIEAGSRLDRSCLAVQGPPGAGKTYNSARLISRLVSEGKRVGVCANSHRVILNLLEEARSQDPAIRIMKVGGADPGIAGIDHEASAATAEGLVANGQVEVVGGTAWLFSRPAMRQALDALIIDEAGQFSLANTVAVATCAKSLVLVGDPQQLDQPTKGSHPPGVDRSALTHVLDGAATLPSDRGIFLDSTWRMHPDICSFVSETSYDGRLRPHEFCALRSIDGVEHGLRWQPVEHSGNRSRSREEAAVVGEIVDGILGAGFTSEHGEKRPLGETDILVITPYNAQVRELRAVLPDGVEAGTVDLFQGREAPVVIYTMASSSAADAPRGLDFLLDPHRFNVAVSRAQRLAVIVGSPDVLDAVPSSVWQIPLVSSMCRYVEVADGSES